MKNFGNLLTTLLLSITFLMQLVITDVLAQHLTSFSDKKLSDISVQQNENRRVMPDIINAKINMNGYKNPSKEVLFSQDFTGFLGVLPDDWSVVGFGEENWTTLENNLAGGDAPEVYMNFAPAFVGNSKLVTPPINTSGNENLMLVYNHYFSNYSSSGAETLRVETSSDGVTWNEVWFLVADESFGPEVNEIAINNDDVGSESFQIAFTFDGDSYEINWWNIDNIELSSMLMHDVAALGIDLPDAFSVGTEQIPKATFQNYGYENADFDVTMSIYLGSEEVYNSTATIIGLLSQADTTISFDPWVPVNAGFYTATATCYLVGDENTDNDTFSKEVEAIDGFSFIEGFSGSVFPPEGWTVEGDEVDNWSKSETNYAGGILPEAKFNWDPQFEGVSRLITPELNSSGLNFMLLSFKQYVHDYAGGYTLSVQSTSDAGNTWNVIWSETISGDLGPETTIVSFTNQDVGSENLQLAFTFEGNNYNIWDWYIDDLSLLQAADYDVAAGNISGIPPENPVGIELLPKAVVNNYSTVPVTFDVSLTINDGTSDIYTSVETVTNAPLLDDIEVVFEPWITENVGEFTVTVESHLTNDGNPENDTSSIQCSVVDGISRNLVILEDFTGTWCGFCPGAQMGIRDLIAFGYPVAGIAWHEGDNYETIESLERISYYGIPGFPTVIADGIEEFVGGSPDSSAWAWYAPYVDERMTQPTSVTIDFSNVSFDGSTFSASINMEAIGTVSNENLVMHAVLTESHIPETWQTQYELLDVQRLTFAGSEGTTVSFINQQTQSLNISFDLESSWIPEFCEVVVFVQDTETKTIFNGNKVHVKEQTEWPSITVFVHNQNGIPVEGATVNFGDFSIETDENGEAIFDDLEAGPYFYSASAEGHLPSSAEVIVVLLDDINLDIELTSTSTGLQTSFSGSIEVFPNPASESIIIKYEGIIKNISITNSLGMLMYLSDENNKQQLNVDVSGFDEGVYFIFMDGQIKKFIKH